MKPEHMTEVVEAADAAQSRVNAALLALGEALDAAGETPPRMPAPGDESPCLCLATTESKCPFQLRMDRLRRHQSAKPESHLLSNGKGAS